LGGVDFLESCVFTSQNNFMSGNTFGGQNVFNNENTFNGQVNAEGRFYFSLEPLLNNAARKTAIPTDTTGAKFATEAQVLTALAGLIIPTSTANIIYGTDGAGLQVNRPLAGFALLARDNTYTEDNIFTNITHFSGDILSNGVNEWNGGQFFYGLNQFFGEIYSEDTNEWYGDQYFYGVNIFDN
jgi:hypothetical protein